MVQNSKCAASPNKELHYGSEQHRIIYFPTSLGISVRAIERMSTAECASNTSSMEQAIELVVLANE